ncbi:MAG TPA: ATP synthase F1 subunit delta [Cyclobacteriaceae bacterium]|nr:ATP synthase F1 subunit delta [Cyclobacteriaceae bacterium]HRK53753.1 ATP synthase F1 subunit delta [Cyclobacteriaceae bacterium]
MSDFRAASRYVRSLLGLAQEQGVLDEVHNDMQLINKTCNDNFELVSLLRSPIIKSDKKKAILYEIFEGRVHQLTLAIIDIITRKKREAILPSIAREFHNAYNDFKGIQKATITSAIALDTEIRKEIEDMVKKLSDKKTIELDEKVDSSLIGGFILNIGDKQVDASISSKLKALKLMFKKNPYIREI